MQSTSSHFPSISSQVHDEYNVSCEVKLTEAALRFNMCMSNIAPSFKNLHPQNQFIFSGCTMYTKFTVTVAVPEIHADSNVLITVATSSV